MSLFSIFVWVLQVSMVIALFVGLPLLLALRIFIAYKENRSLKEILIIILVPLSIGYFIYIEDDSKYNKLYKRVMLVVMVLAILGILFTIYQGYL